MKFRLYLLILMWWQGPKPIKQLIFRKENVKSDLHHFLLLYYKANKVNIEGAWWLPSQESLELIIALKEFSLERRSEFYDLLDLGKRMIFLPALNVRFHLIPAPELSNINTEKVEALPLAA